MVRGKIRVAIGFVTLVTLVAGAQMNERREGGSPRVVVVQPQPQPPAGPIPMIAMREYAEQLRVRGDRPRNWPIGCAARRMRLTRWPCSR